MKHTSKFRSLTATLFTIGVLTGGANAALVITAEEIYSTGDVVFSWGGGTIADSAVDISAMSQTVATDYAPPGGISPNAGVFASTPSAIAQGYTTVDLAITTFGLGGFSTTSINTGSSIWVDDRFNDIGVPFGYTSLSIIAAGSMTFEGATFASLGITPTDTIIADWGVTGGDDSISIKFIPVPEPSSALLFGLAALGFSARRRR